MAGRYAGNGRGRNGGRGRSSGRGRGRFPRQHKKPEFEMKFFPNTSGRSSKVTFNTVKDHIENQIQKTYTYGIDIVRTLRDMKRIDLNELKPDEPTSDDAVTETATVATATTADSSVFEKELKQKMYMEEYKMYLERENTYKNNLIKALRIDIQLLRAIHSNEN